MSRFCMVALTGVALVLGQAALAADSPAIARPAPAKLVKSPRKAATRPAATLPATTAVLSEAEALALKYKEAEEAKKQLPQVAVFDLSSTLSEKPAEFLFFADQNALTHLNLVKRLLQAAEDKQIAAVLLTLRDPEIKLAQAQELRDALDRIRAAGKKVIVYADQYSTAGYIMATGASEICLLQGGEIEMPGVAVETMFAKGLLDKIGVQADMIQIGEYKGADESMTRTNASTELRGEMSRLVDSLYSQITRDISTRRNIPEKSVKALIDQAMISADSARQSHLVDTLVDIDGMRQLLARRLNAKEVELVKDYGQEERAEIDFSNPFALFQLLGKKSQVATGPAVAVVYVDGMIVSGDGSDSMFSDSVAADGEIRKAMRLALRDSDIKAVVLRIDSPGGSALASEAAWQSIRRVAEKKTVIISVGGMAPSGGYYIASAGQRIFADPAAIVGSIGVVGGKFAMNGLYEKLGINTELFAKGENAGMFSSSQPFTDNQRVMIRNLMKQTYEQFVDRILTTRAQQIKDIDKVARGRIFAGEKALEVGLVDEIGGIQKAIDYAADKGGLQPGKYDLRVLPAPKTLADMISGNAQVQSTVKPSVQSIPAQLMVLPPAARKMIFWEIALSTELSRRPVMVVTPVLLQVR